MSSLPKTGNSFIDEYAPDAIQSQKQTGVPASFTLAQALIESGRGESALTRKALNFFGIKGEGPAGYVLMNTREENAQGQSYYIEAKFAKYNTAAECFVEHGQIFLKPRYAPAMAVKTDARAFARQVQACGYATAHNYADVLIGVINRYALTRFDQIALGTAPAPQTPTSQTVAPPTTAPQATAPQATAPQATARPTLSLRSSGEAVVNLQRALVRVGYLKANEVDGEFGPMTQAALENFQRSKGLTVDGVCGPRTWSALGV